MTQTVLAEASSVSCGVDGPGFELRQEQDIFSKTFQTIQPPTQWGYQCLMLV